MFEPNKKQEKKEKKCTRAHTTQNDSTTNLLKKQASQTNKKQTIDHKFYATKKRRQSQKMQALGNLICETIAMRERESGDDDIERSAWARRGGEGRERGRNRKRCYRSKAYTPWKKQKKLCQTLVLSSTTIS
jgi:hypothetical protein